MNGETLVRQYLVSGNEMVRDQAVQAFLPLVRHIVNRLNIPPSETLSKSDFYQFGILGLLDALKRYRPEMGTQFKTFAYKRIYGEIIDAVRQHGYLSRAQLDLVKKIETAERSLTIALQREPALSEICEHLNIAEEEYYSIIQNAQLNYSISLMMSDGNDNTSQAGNLDIIPDQNQLSPDEQLAEESLKAELKQIIVKLPEKQRLILALYYYEELTLSDIGQVLGVSESRISQILNETLVKIRGRLKL
ncbi:MAG: FliA/WhiG family RNA polymerase sigma factor [Candidatus Neomarinimicrobiota bacterium]